jgi:hypothetical protein
METGMNKSLLALALTFGLAGFAANAQTVSGAARQCGDAGAGLIRQAQRPHQIGEGIQFFGRAGDFEDKAFQRRIHDAGAEDLGDAQRLDALFALARP